MKKKRLIIGIIFISISLLISACTPTNPPNDGNNASADSEEEIRERDARIAELEQRNSELEQQIEDLEEVEEDEDEDEADEDEAEEIEEDEDDDEDSQEDIDDENQGDSNLLVVMGKVLETLKEEEIEELKKYIHPQKGVRFSAYPYVDLEEDIVLNKDEIVEVYSSSETYIWGTTDGEGADIELTFKDYFKRYVYDEDFFNAPVIGVNTILSGGNTIDNVEEAYPDGEFFEFYFEEFNEEYAGQDWRSLKLVFEKHDDKWYLVGLTHGEWTI